MKIYKTKTKYNGVSVKLTVNGVSKYIKFTGGKQGKQGKLIPGSYNSVDASEQKAIESHGWFNRYFYLAHDDGKAPINLKPNPAPNVTNETVTTSNKEMEKNNPVDETPDVQPGITNLNDVKEYLVYKITGLTFNEVKNSKQAIDIAKKYNIEFPDWGKWIEMK